MELNKQKELTLEKIKKIWLANPEMRLGQLLCSAANYGALYYAEDELLVQILEQKYSINTSDVKEPVKEVIKETKVKKPTYKRTMPKNEGRVYIHEKSSGKVKAVFKEDLDDYLNNGWVLGRKDLN